MVKLGLFQEEDDKKQLTGRWQVADDAEGSDDVYDTFDTKEEAQVAMEKMQAEFDRNDKIDKEYLEWEKECMEQNRIGQEDLRVWLVNGVMG